MSFQYHELLCCPLDQLPLAQLEHCLQCANGHSFDIARQGYVNLLGAGDKRSREPGDSKEMVAARRGFLNGGHYQPVAEKLAEWVAPRIGADSVIVDAGCGEGYYLDQLRAQLEAKGNISPAIIGFDISKRAVQAATRRLTATWLVASNRNIPLPPGSVDCVLSLVGFPVYESFLEVLREDGFLLVVSAGPQHLIELREILYPSITHSESRIMQQAQTAGFASGEVSTIQFVTAPLSQLEINQLLGMTPHLFRASREGRKRSALLDQFPVTVDVVFHLFHKPSGG
jgi:23S rRNA (guanine745-N1)-methyltransferase